VIFFKSQHKVQAEDKAGMGGEEVVAPEIEVIGAEGEIKAGGRLEVVVKLPGMHGANHGGQRSTLRQGDVVAQVLVVGIGVVASAIAHPPRVAAPEKAVVGRDGTIEIESRGEIGEVHAVVEVERRNDLATHIEPLAEGQAAPNQGAPIGAVGTRVEVDTGIDMGREAILEGGVGLLLIESRAALQRRVAVEFAIAHGSREIGNLGNGSQRKQHDYYY